MWIGTVDSASLLCWGCSICNFFTVLGCRQIDLCYLANSIGANHANQHKNGDEEDLLKIPRRVGRVDLKYDFFLKGPPTPILALVCTVCTNGLFCT